MVVWLLLSMKMANLNLKQLRSVIPPGWMKWLEKIMTKYKLAKKREKS